MEANQAQRAILNALEKILKPIVLVILKFGCSYDQFEDVARRAFVDVAQENFEFPRKKVTDSWLSVITGMSRRSIKEIMKGETSQDHSGNALGKDAVMSGWLTDPKFLNSSGVPLILTKNGQLGFDSVVNQSSAETNYIDLVKELVESSICIEEDGNIELLSDSNVDLSEPQAAVIDAWKTNPNFTDKWGRPKILPTKGQPGFVDLCKAYGGNNPEMAILSVLLELGCCRELSPNEDGEIRYKPVGVGVVPKNSRPKQIELGFDNAALHMETVVHNIFSTADSAYSELLVLGKDVPNEEIEQLHLSGAIETEKAINKIDEKIMNVDRKYNKNVTGTGSNKIGFGFFYFKGDGENQ